MPSGDHASRREFLTLGGAAAASMVSLAAGPEVAQAQQAPAPGAGQIVAAEFAWGDGIRRIKSAGKMVFAQAGNMVPPQYYHDPSTNEPAGYDAEIARMIAKDLGVEPVFEEAVVSARVIGLQAGKYDVVMG